MKLLVVLPTYGALVFWWLRDVGRHRYFLVNALQKPPRILEPCGAWQGTVHHTHGKHVPA